MLQQDVSHWLNQPLYTQPLKAVLIGLIIVLCILSLQPLKNSVAERIQQEQLKAEQFKHTWGSRQQIIGPLLVIPYTDHLNSVDTVTEGSGESKVISKDVYNDYTAVILPSSLNIRADLSEAANDKDPSKSAAYKANVSLSGRFDYGYLLGESDAERAIHWNKAFLALAMSDTRALIKSTAMQWNNEKIFLQPGNPLAQLPQTGLHLPLEKLAAKNSVHEFKIDFMLQGSEQFLVAPVGETTTARLSSNWEHADFQHSLTPTKHEQNNLGFNASWELANLARSYPQHWLVEDKTNFNLSAASIGVDITQTQTPSSQLQALLSYASWALLISLVILFSFELINQQPVNLLQYLLLGSLQVLFFALVLGLSREFPLKTAYLITAISCLLVSLIHSSLIFKSIFQGLVITALLSGLYYVLYLVLNADTRLMPTASVYAGLLGLLGLSVAWVLVPESVKILRPDELSEQEENTHI